MQYFRSLLCLLLGVASSPLALAEPGVPGPVEYNGVLVARDFHHFWAQDAPKDLNKRQTPEEVCGVNYVLCDTTHCCQAGTYCERRSTGWYCPVVSGRSSIVYTSYYYTSTIVDNSPIRTTQYIYTETPSPTRYRPSPTDSGVNSGDTDGDNGTGGTKKKKSGLGTGPIIGIVVAVVILGIIAAVGGFFYIRSKKKAAPLPAPPMQSAPQQPYTAPPEPQQPYGVPPPQGYYPAQGQYPPQEQYSQYPQQPYTVPQSPAPQYHQPGYAAPPVGDNAIKAPTPGAGYYQPGHSGAVEAMSEPARSPAPQGQAQAPPPPKPNVYEI